MKFDVDLVNRGEGVVIKGTLFPGEERVKNLPNTYGCIPMFHSPTTIEIPSMLIFDGKKMPVVALNGYLFQNCLDIETLVIPRTVTKIHWNGRNRELLKEIKVEEGNKVFQSIDGVLYTKYGFNRDGDYKNHKWMELIAYPNAKGDTYNVVDGTTRLGNQCFKYTNISNLELPQTLMEIGVGAFYECVNLKNVIIPTSVNKIEGCKHSFTNYLWTGR